MSRSSEDPYLELLREELGIDGDLRAPTGMPAPSRRVAPTGS